MHLANYGEYVGSTSPVGIYPPNKFGLYDMAGNLEEWCMDWYIPSNSLEVSKCTLLFKSHEKTVKGGSWNKDKSSLMCKSRRGKWYRIGTASIGCRIVWDHCL